MQLGAPARPDSVPDEIATAVRAAAARLGHRPAITQLMPAGRQEQSVASLAQWAAKGAHFLELELGLAPGDRIHLAAPPGWNTAAVALAAWWAGIGLTVSSPAASELLPTPEVEVAVLHTARPVHATADMTVFWLGDGIDGAPAGDVAASEPAGEPWVHAVQSFPDQPPLPRASPDAVAVIEGSRVTTQAALLQLATTHGEQAPLGLDGAGEDPTLDLALLCLRPLLCGRPTVVVRGVPRAAAEGDRVGRWR